MWSWVYAGRQQKRYSHSRPIDEDIPCPVPQLENVEQRRAHPVRVLNDACDQTKMNIKQP